MVRIRPTVADDWLLVREATLRSQREQRTEARWAFRDVEHAERLQLQTSDRQWFDFTQETPRLWQSFLAVAERGVVGLVCAGMQEDRVAFFGNLWVEPEMRSQGIASRLIGTCAVWAKRNGASTLRLSVESNNHGARALYDKLGFVPTGDVDYLVPDTNGPLIELSARLRRRLLVTHGRGVE